MIGEHVMNLFSVNMWRFLFSVSMWHFFFLGEHLTNLFSANMGRFFFLGEHVAILFARWSCCDSFSRWTYDDSFLSVNIWRIFSLWTYGNFLLVEYVAILFFPVNIRQFFFSRWTCGDSFFLVNMWQFFFLGEHGTIPFFFGEHVMILFSLWTCDDCFLGEKLVRYVLDCYWNKSELLTFWVNSQFGTELAAPSTVVLIKRYFMTLEVNNHKRQWERK